MNKKDQLILVIGILLIVFGTKNLYKPTAITVPQPDTPIVLPDDHVVPTPPKPPIEPELRTNIFYDECEKANKLSKQLNKPLVLIFVASWCPYCKDLKKDLLHIKQFNNAVVCILDIEKNSKTVEKYSIKILPTSVIVKADKEQSRYSGYKRENYETWLNGNI